jgi:hypothetical protein
LEKTCFLLQNRLRFAAKHNTICSKTQGKMQQNARQNAAKRKVKWCKMQGEMHQYTKQDASLCT